MAVGMILIARPKGGETVPFLRDRHWVIGQALIGILFLAAGAAKLAGMEFMSEPFAMMGLGKSALVLAGSVEIVAGVCLLSPRVGVVGAVLVTILMVGTIGVIAG